ncbi:MAG: family 20 glycosylhydrolase [Kiritimatiellae bacterium]|nr:family 20 glycosylhydrolase [Kiritimatiellia bacterium]
MKTKTLLPLLAAMALSPVMAENWPNLVNALNVAPRVEGDRLTLPEVPDATVRFLGADYEQIILPDGRVQKPLTDTHVKVSFLVTRGEETVASRDYDVVVPGEVTPAADANPRPFVFPELLNWAGGKGAYTLASTVRLSGATPAMATQLAAELRDLAGRDTVVVSAGETADVTLSLCEDARLGKEGYTLEITADGGVKIAAATETGLFWGTRSLLQMVVSGKGSLPCGRALDIPRYQVRGFLLDVGRLPIPMSYLYDVVKYMAWFKMNDLHVHLNDNFIFLEDYVRAKRDPLKEAYSAFRLESKVVGANGQALTAPDLSYTKAEFQNFIAFAKSYGVNIIPEFDTPAHALAFTKVRPDLIYKSNNLRGAEMLDATNPATHDFVESVFDEYLLPQDGKPAVFSGCDVMHVGADEFHGDAEHYRAYAAWILDMVQKKGYTPRIWGSLNEKKGKTPVPGKGAQMNLWNGSWAKAWDSINQGFDVINTTDGALYIVPFAEYYRMDFNQPGIYTYWRVNEIAGQYVPSGHPQLIGGVFGIWNDMIDLRYVGYGSYDIWNMFTSSVDILAGKLWGADVPDVGYDAHMKRLPQVGKVPGINPYYLWPNGASYVCVPTTLPCKMGQPAMGPNYTLTMQVQLDAEPTPGQEQILLKSPEGVFYAAMKDGTIGFRRNDSIEFSFNCKLPVGKKVTLQLIGEPGRTQLLIDGVPCTDCSLPRFHNNKEGIINTFVLPLDEVGTSFNGKVYRLEVKHTTPAGPTPDPHRKKK